VGHRLIVPHDPVRAQEQITLRANRIEAVRSRAEHLAGMLDGQGVDVVHRGRTLSDSGVKARFFHAVAEAHLCKIIKVDPKSDLFAYDIAEVAL
jgi:hypothetical protein